MKPLHLAAVTLLALCFSAAEAQINLGVSMAPASGTVSEVLSGSFDAAGTDDLSADMSGGSFLGGGSNDWLFAGGLILLVFGVGELISHWDGIGPSEPPHVALVSEPAGSTALLVLAACTGLTGLSSRRRRPS
jgi:hypothetical protein